MHRTYIQLISKSIQCTRNKSRFPKKKPTYLIQYFRVRIYLVVFKMLNLFRTRNNKYSKEKICLPQVIPSPLFTKKLNPRHIGRDLHNLRTYHYKHNKRSISISPTTVIVRKKDIAFLHIRPRSWRTLTFWSSISQFRFLLSQKCFKQKMITIGPVVFKA